MIKAIIIEDEPFAQNELKRLLKQTKYDVEIVQSIESIEDAVDWLKNKPLPDLIFQDIQLSDGISFEIFNKIEVKAPIIFTTAYDEFAIRAFKVNSIDYLLKPIVLADLCTALDKYIDLNGDNEKTSTELTSTQVSELLQMLNNEKKHKQRFVSKIGDQIKYVSVEEVAYFYAEESEVFLMTHEGKRLLIDYTLDHIVAEIDPIKFHRVNRRFLVNIKAVNKVHKYFNSRIKIELIPHVAQEIIISRVKVSDFFKWLEG